VLILILILKDLWWVIKLVMKVLIKINKINRNNVKKTYNKIHNWKDFCKYKTKNNQKFINNKLRSILKMQEKKVKDNLDIWVLGQDMENSFPTEQLLNNRKKCFNKLNKRNK
jgi:hypothetical protein